ncbi:MAG: fused MFS/spermidine synthase [Desulfobacteraceae bacterium]|nr:fused MFS/spermidine synthase [Desulfobacteraceae bacterium]
MQAPARRLAVFILVCFFLSGMTALIYQIIWMRLISRVVGAAPFAVSAILVVFMAGLGLGGYVAGRMSSRWHGIGLVRVYGVLEIATAVYAFFVPALLLLSGGIYGILYNNFYEHTLVFNFFVFAGALLLLGFPTICMGATLPILCRFYVSSLAHLGTHAGRLYGLNTFGAALGALVCGFWMISTLGIWGSMLVAVLINATIGLTCILIRPAAATGRSDSGAKEKENGAGKRGGSSVKKISLPANTYPRRTANTALAVFLVSGFCAMVCEVFWTRLLGLVVGPTTYSFTIVLVTFITGLALGNVIFGRWADKTVNAFSLLIITQVLAAFSALVISHIFGNSQLFFAKLIYAFRDQFGLLAGVEALVLFGFMVLPTLFFGAAFPLVAKIHTQSIEGVGRSIGVIYAFNTIGDVFGAFFAGFILMPLVGMETGLKIVIGMQVAAALAAVLFAVKIGMRFSPRRAVPAAVFAAGVLFMCLVYPAWNRHVLATGKYHRFEEAEAVKQAIQGTGWLQSFVSGAQILADVERGELVYYGEGIGGFTTVLKYPGPFGKAEYSMANSGKMDASSRGDMNTQTLLAHFPMLFAKDPEKVMVLGLASGVTAGEVLHYPVERLDVIDINECVFEAARFFSQWNNNVLDNRRTRAILQDALAHLTLSRTSYDVIISEPSNPWMAGMASLFTRDFFETAKKSLEDNGIYVQWFHCYQMDWPTFALIGRSFAEVFPDSILVSCDPGGLAKDFLFVGFKDEAGLNWEQAGDNIDYARRSSNIELARPKLLLRLIVSEDLSRLFGPGPINTEDLPLLEYSAPRLMYRGKETQEVLLEKLKDRAWLSPDTASAAGRIRESVEDQIDFAEFALSVYSPFKGMVDLSRADSEQKKRFEALLADYCRENPMDLNLVKDRKIARRLHAIQIDSIKSKLPEIKYKAPARSYLASLLDEAGRTGEAAEHYQKALALDPGDARVHNDLGFLLYRKGDMDSAISHFKKVIELRPGFIKAMGNMAFAQLKKNSLDNALFYFKETLRVRPDIAESHYYAGYILTRQNRLAEAADHLREAVRLKPDMAQALNILAWIQATVKERSLRDPKSAVENAKKACSLTGEKSPVMLTTLAIAYNAAGRPAEAEKTAALALKKARDSGRKDLSARIESQLKRHIR